MNPCKLSVALNVVAFAALLAVCCVGLGEGATQEVLNDPIQNNLWFCERCETAR